MNQNPNPSFEIEGAIAEIPLQDSCENSFIPNSPLLRRRDLITSLLGAAGAITAGALTETDAKAAGGASTTVYYADTQADLRALTGSGTTLAILKGYGTIGDGGGGIFYWNTISTLDDGGIVINATAGSTTAGWRRIYSGPIDVRWFGAIPNGAPADPGIQAAINACAALGGGKVIFPKIPKLSNGNGGAYAIYNTINIIDNGVNNMWNITLCGDSDGSAAQSQIQLIWYGANPAPVIKLYSRDCLIENLGIIAGSATPALCAIDITQSVTGSQASAFNTIRRVNISGVMHYGIKMGDVGNGSSYPTTASRYVFEFVYVDLSQGYGKSFNKVTYSQACFYCPNNTGYCINHRWVGVNVYGATNGFWFVKCAGSFDNISFGQLNFGVWLDDVCNSSTVCDSLTFTDCYSELMERFLFYNGNSAKPCPITVRGGTHDTGPLPNTDAVVNGVTYPGTANCWVYANLLGPITFESVQWLYSTPGNALYFKSYALNHGSKVTMRNCTIPYLKWGATGQSHGGVTEFNHESCIGYNDSTSLDFPLPDATGTTGTVTISGTATTATVTLPSSVTGYSPGVLGDSPPYSSGYAISLSAGMAVGTSSVATGALRASYKSKTSTNFVIALEAAPGTGKTVEIAWRVRANTSFWV